MKVLYVANIDPQETGGTKRAFEVIRRVGHYGVEPYVIQPSASKVGLLSRIGALRSLQMIFSAFDFRNELDIDDLDLIVSSSESPETAIPGYLLSRRLDVPWTVIVQLPIIFKHTPASTTPIFKDLLWSPQQLLVSYILRNTVPLAVSRTAILESTIQPKEFIELKTPVGVDWETIRQASPPSENFDAFYLARLIPEKGLFDIVKIWKKVVRDKDDAKLVVAGKFAEERKKRRFFHLVENANLKGNIEYRGYLSEQEKFSFMKGAKVFVYPSRLDCFPIVVLEALACGTPVIAYNIPAITFNYPTGIVKTVPEKDIDAFANNIAEMLSRDCDSSEKYSEVSKDFASRFTWDEVAKEEVKAYRIFIEARHKKQRLKRENRARKNHKKMKNMKKEKEFWEKSSIERFGRTDESRLETKYNRKQQQYIRSLITTNSTILKTDLWNEGVTRGVFSVGLFKDSWFIGVDISRRICMKAKCKHRWLEVINADIGFLPFRKNVFDALLDISASDHMSFTDFCNCLRNYDRILKPKGQLLLIFNKYNILLKIVRFFRKLLGLGHSVRYTYFFHPNRVRTQMKQFFKIQIEQNYGPNHYSLNIVPLRQGLIKTNLPFLHGSYLIYATTTKHVGTRLQVGGYVDGSGISLPQSVM